VTPDNHRPIVVEKRFATAASSACKQAFLPLMTDAWTNPRRRSPDGYRAPILSFDAVVHSVMTVT
jgi:hypothetical protein